MIGIFIAVIVLIAYGSLYPWAFEARSLYASPFYILLHSWDANVIDRRFVFDVALNIAIYIPLGLSGYLAFRRSQPRVVGIVAPVAIGTVLSASIEMIQLFTPTRQCSSIDLADNILGSILGLIAGVVFTRIVDIPLGGPLFRVRDRGAIALLACWIAFLLFPIFPVLSLGVWRAKFAAFGHARVMDPIPLMLSAAEWFAAGRLASAAGANQPARWLLALFVLLLVQFGIVNRTPLPADFAGAAVALVACYLFGRARRADGLAGIALLAAVAIRGLAPFHFEGPPQAFLWVPFEGVLTSVWQDSTVILLGKLFQYGASLWLLSRTRLGLGWATILVTAVLTGIEALQTRIPGHVPEITDPLLGVMLGLALLTSHGRKTAFGRGND